jgi:hypothetical protein
MRASCFSIFVNAFTGKAILVNKAIRIILLVIVHSKNLHFQSTRIQGLNFKIIISVFDGIIMSAFEANKKGFVYAIKGGGCDFKTAQIDHRLNGKSHAFFKYWTVSDIHLEMKRQMCLCLC